MNAEKKGEGGFKKARLKHPIINFLRRRKTAIIVLAILLIAGGLAAVMLKPEEREGKPVPDFSLRNVHDGTIHLSDYRGKPVLIDFMAVNCPSCNRMMPVLKELSDSYGNGIVIISIDIYSDETEAELKAHMDGYGATWPAGVDKTGEIKKAYMEGGYITRGIPTFVLVDQRGYVVWVRDGIVDKNEFIENIDRTLAGQAKPLSISSQNILILSYTLGLFMFFSPCALPLLPGYMGYYMAKHGGGAIISVKNGAIAASGIFATYLLIGGFASFLGAAVGTIILSAIPIIGAFLVLLGILMFFHVQIPAYKISNAFVRIACSIRKKAGAEASVNSCEKKEKGLFSYGLIYGTASMACNLPVFLGVVLVALMTGPLYGLLALMLFGLGMATLMIAVTVLVGLAKKAILSRFIAYMGLMNKISALILIVMGLYLIFESMAMV